MTNGERPAEEIARLLAEEFPAGAVKYRAGAVQGKRALALPYVDARVIQDRLDSVLGVMGWQDTYDCLDDGSVVCRLSLKIGGEWICKVDVGGQSEQPDEGDRRKAAFSDALKRAAVKFGIGRYLYRLQARWVDYDPQKKRLVGAPGAPAAPEQPDPDAQQHLARWREWIDSRPDLRDVNTTCTERLSKASRAVKPAAWELVCKYAHARGWTFDGTRKEFVAAAPA